MTDEEKIENENLESNEQETPPESAEDTEEGKKEEKGTLKLPPQEDTVEVDGVKYPKELIEKARKDGWRDKSFLEGKGMEGKYLDPATFVERGEKAVPFLNKKLSKLEDENSTLKEMMKKQMADSVKDRMDNLDNKIKDAKDMGEDYESLIERKMNLKSQHDEYSKPEENPQEIQRQTPKKPIEQIAWEMKNPWIFDKSNPYNSAKAAEANRIFEQIHSFDPNLDLDTRFQLLDRNLSDFDKKINQKENNSLPLQSSSSSATAPVSRTTIDNLTPQMKKVYDSTCVDNRGNKFTGEALKAAKEAFLSSCTDECFKK